MLNEEVSKYRELSGDISPNVPISRIGGYLDGYEKALEQEPNDFARWVAREIFDDEWEYNKDAFVEIACRKLEKLGIVRAKGDEWELLEQEPCEDEYIKIPKKALKYRTSGMVAYNVEWLKNHFDIERAVICGAQEPCEDAISRQTVLDAMRNNYRDGGRDIDGDYVEGTYSKKLYDVIISLPSVNPQPKTGHWKQISPQDIYECSKCGQNVMTSDICAYRFCQGCGAKMESEDINVRDQA